MEIPEGTENDKKGYWKKLLKVLFGLMQSGCLRNDKAYNKLTHIGFKWFKSEPCI